MEASPDLLDLNDPVPGPDEYALHEGELGDELHILHTSMCFIFIHIVQGFRQRRAHLDAQQRAEYRASAMHTLVRIRVLEQRHREWRRLQAARAQLAAWAAASRRP